MTLNELVYDIINTSRGGTTSDDEDISNELIKFWIKTTRALLIRQDINKGRTISENIITNIECQEIIQVDSSDCSCMGLDADCTIWRTKDKMPKLIEVGEEDLLLRVSPSEKLSIAYTITNQVRIPFVKHSRYSKARFAFWYNQYVYVVDPYHYNTMITIKAVLEDPEEACALKNCSTGNVCCDDNTEFPLSAWMVDAVKKTILKEYIRVAVVAPNDISGDSKSNPVQLIQQDQ